MPACVRCGYLPIARELKGQGMSLRQIAAELTDFVSNAGGTVTYRTIVETAPQDVLQAANPNLPALGLTSFTIAGPPP